MLISLLVVGGAVAVVLLITAGAMGQPATQDEPPAGGADREDARAPHDDVDTNPETPPVTPPEVAPDRGPDAAGPAERTVPQAARSRPAEPAAVAPAPARTGRTVAVPGSYSFDPAPQLTVGRRVRSALGVVLVVTGVGLTLAASVGLLVVVVSRALEGAVN